MAAEACDQCGLTSSDTHCCALMPAAAETTGYPYGDPELQGVSCQAACMELPVWSCMYGAACMELHGL
jgi:hypothetical protein